MSPPEERRAGDPSPSRYLPPWLIQSVGIVLLITAGIFWAVTGRESVLMISSAMTLIAAGVVRGAQVTIKRNGNGR